MKPTRETLYDLYVTQTKSDPEIAPLYGVSYKTINRWRHKLKITTRPQSECMRMRHRRDSIYYMDEPFLDKWSPELAWLLGLLFADGHIGTDRSRTMLTAKDTKFLEQVRDLLKSNFRIEYAATTPQLIINRMDRVEKFERYGITKSKTYTATFPFVPIEFIHHFVRGFLDGDGCISIRGNHEVSIGFEISSKSFADSLFIIIQEIPNITNPYFTTRDRTNNPPRTDSHWNIHSTRPIYSIRLWGNNARIFINWLYQDSYPLIRMERKYNKALPFITL